MPPVWVPFQGVSRVHGLKGQQAETQLGFSCPPSPKSTSHRALALVRWKQKHFSRKRSQTAQLSLRKPWGNRLGEGGLSTQGPWGWHLLPSPRGPPFVSSPSLHGINLRVRGNLLPAPGPSGMTVTPVFSAQGPSHSGALEAPAPAPRVIDGELRPGETMTWPGTEPRSPLPSVCLPWTESAGLVLPGVTGGGAGTLPTGARGPRTTGTMGAQKGAGGGRAS